MKLSGIGRLMRRLARRAAKRQAASAYALVEQSGLFDRMWYLAMNPDVAARAVDPLEHYLEWGWREGRNPGPNFDGSQYLRHYPQARKTSGGPLLHHLLTRSEGDQGDAILSLSARVQSLDRDAASEACRDIDESGLFDRAAYLSTYSDVAGLGVDPVCHYIEFGWKEGRSPGGFFDASWYLQHNPDVAQAASNPLLHYVRFGMKEGRMPNAIFDSDWYERYIVRAGAEAGLTPYAIYRLRGIENGDPPLPELLPVYQCRAAFSGDLYDQYVRLVAAARPWWDRFGRDGFSVLVKLFSPYGEGIEAESGDAVERLIEFLTAAWQRDVDPGPLFSGNHYRRVLCSHGVTLHDGDTPLRHFLREGFDKRIVPTPCFDEQYYYATYPDIDREAMWAFEHFIRWGVFEGRRATGRPRPVVVPFPALTTEGQARLHNWKSFLSSCGVSGDLDEAYREAGHYARMVDDIVTSAIFAETMRRASRFEPAIGDVADIGEVLVPPFHDARNLARRALRTLFQRSHYDTIVCVPWIRTGGADLVACQISEAIRLARPNESVLLLRTDQPNFDRPEWVPAGVDVVDASGVFRGLPSIDAQTLLYGVFMGLTPSRVINVNSRLCWDTIARYGTRLSDRVHLYSYLFCWDQTPSGYRVGYPSEFFPETAHILRAVLTDTVYLKNELTTIYNLPPAVSKRIVPLFSPARSQIDGSTMAEESLKRTNKRRRWKILWAGRLDRQKRFDLVQEIARKMPDADFLCWGTPLLDAPPDYRNSPRNLVLTDGFSSYAELPLDDADLWLFTSEWEGMPTLLIELAQRGVCVVASAVGGVPELIDELTGWPVTDVRSVDAYVSAIRAALANPQERVKRARHLHERSRSRHSMPAYVKQISDVLNDEVCE
ncbi:glycosyltransferase family 4 protein [Burkholderia diffusa]|uniref:glycosyltransferase family 4 protein n=1 Tax=Burkholderia diffusa TaxID=488732 RepID=UPI0018C4FB42|nr:glycosyltransferase family 4 protein [Burkholderia diffusa]